MCLKKCLAVMLVVWTGVVSSCQYDDDELWNSVNDLSGRVSALESLTKQMNGDISAVQSIVSALEKNVSVTSVDSLTDGYAIHFSDGTKAVIKNGADGKDGAPGKNGKDGLNAPVINIAKENGVYYWTITTDGVTTWLLDDDGNKLPVSGKNGANGAPGLPGAPGANGKNGVTPLLKVDAEGYWMVSYDKGVTYVYVKNTNGDKVNALGQSGNAGSDGTGGTGTTTGWLQFDENGPVKDNGDGTITIKMADGTEFVLAKGSSVVYKVGNTVLESMQNLSLSYSNALVLTYEVAKIENPSVEILKAENVEVTVNKDNSTLSIKQESGKCGGKVVILYYNDGQNVISVLTFDSSTVHVATLNDLKSAIANGYNVILDADITSSEIIVIDKPITLDGNDHKLTSTAGRAINVSGADGVTIKNLTIEASGERAINIIQHATNVTIDHVTATAANYTVNVASSAPAAKVVISNSTLTGLDVVNVASADADITVSKSTINCNDNNPAEGYAALNLNKLAVGGKIVATECTINVTQGSGSVKGSNGAENGEVTINGSTEGVEVVTAIIVYEGNDYYYAFKTLSEAIEYAKDKEIGVIKLIRDIALTEEWTPAGTADAPFKGTFDGNGKIISGLTISSGNYVGLFGYVSEGATIKNVTLKDVNVSGGKRVGALIGQIKGDAEVTNCIVSGEVSGSDSNTGGLIGEIINGTVTLTNLSNNASVINTATSSGRAGGIAGQVTTNAKVTLTNCRNTGNITTNNGYAGGIVSAYQSGTLTIDNCTNSGTLSGAYTGNMLGWYTSVRSITISSENNGFDLNAIGCVDITISSNMSLYGKNYFVNKKDDLTGVTDTKQAFSDIFADGAIGTSPKQLWDKLIAFYAHAAETNVHFAGYPKTYWEMFNQPVGYSEPDWNSYFNSYNAEAADDMKLTKDEFSSASWREKIVYLAPGD